MLKNKKYDDTEKSFLHGDILRAQPHQNFPWFLTSAAFQDADQDTWLVEVFCEGIIAVNHNTFSLQLDLLAKARCLIRDETAQKLELDSKRLKSLGLKDWNILTENLKASVEAPMNALSEKAKRMVAIMEERILKKHSLESKRQVIWGQLKNCRLSKFSGVSNFTN